MNNRRIYRSALGKVVDVDSLRIANEESIAVGNMKVNARGDELGPGGVILKKKSEIEAERNALPVAKKASGPRPAVGPEDAKPALQADPVTEAKQQEYVPVEFPDDVDDDDVSVEPAAPANKPAMRGSLAASVAGTKTVEQSLQKDPRKPTGPRRI